MLRHRSIRDERGSVAIAITVAMVATLTLLATIGMVSGGQTSARNDQNRTNSFQFANAGIDQALFRIDGNVLPSTAVGSYVPRFNSSTGAYVGFDETLSINGSSFAVVARQDPPGQTTKWKVRSTGTDGVSSGRRQAIATITARPIFIDGFFTFDDFRVTGNQTNENFPIAYNSALCQNPPIANVAAPVGAGTSCNLGYPVGGTIGTNSEFVFSSSTRQRFLERWTGFHMYGAADQAAADSRCDSGGCGTAPKVRAVTNQREVYVPPRPAGIQSCPNGGTFTGAIAPGNYLCANVTFNGNVTVSGTGNVRIWFTNAITFGSGAVVNRGQRPLRMQLFGESRTGGGQFCNAELWGLLYAPGLRIDCNGNHNNTVFGSVVADFSSQSGNHFAFHWDVSSGAAVNDGLYVVKNWRECPAALTDC